ncbi:MAG: metal-dependent transcriptional regulator [Thermoproteales archaeon]|nr:metal-dependent transcriptional regulator [Thermoproteales archaeon]
MEAMYILLKEKGVIRVKDLAKTLKVKPASVVNFMDNLKEKGLVRYEKHEVLTLTRKGKGKARRIYSKHVKLKAFLQEILRIPEDIAEEDACYIEHGIHEKTLKRIIKFTEFIKGYSQKDEKFARALKNFFKTSG